MTVLGLSVCMLIPFVGPLVALGYIFRRFGRERQNHPVEDFDFNQFGEYLKIGLWPFLTTMVLSVILVPAIFIAMLPIMIGPTIDPENEGLIFAMIGIGILAYFAAILLYMLFAFPVMLRSGLMMDFKAGFSWAFISSFIKKVGWSLILWYVLLVIIIIPLSLIGYLALIVGAYVVMVWAQVAMMSLLFQHYDLYLERGGKPIEFASELTRDYGVPPLPTFSRPPALPSETPSDGGGENSIGEG